MFKIFILLLLLVFTIKATAFGKQKETKGLDGSEMVAEINGQKVTRKEFGDFLIEAYGDMALDFLIKKKTIEQEAKKTNAKVTEAELNERLSIKADTRIIGMMNEQGLKSREDLELELFKTGMTLDKLRKNIIETIKNQTALELLTEKILLEELSFTEEELKEAYSNLFGEKIRANQIVLKTKKKAEEVLKKLAGSADFGKLAKKESIDRASAARNGEMSPFGADSVLGRSVASLKNGQISDIVETGYGYHILQLIDKIPASDKKFEEVVEQLEIFVKREKLNQKVQPWLRTLFDTAKVEVFL